MNRVVPITVAMLLGALPPAAAQPPGDLVEPRASSLAAGDDDSLEHAPSLKRRVFETGVGTGASAVAWVTVFPMSAVLMTAMLMGGGAAIALFLGSEYVRSGGEAIGCAACGAFLAIPVVWFVAVPLSGIAAEVAASAAFVFTQKSLNRATPRTIASLVTAAFIPPGCGALVLACPWAMAFVAAAQYGELQSPRHRTAFSVVTVALVAAFLASPILAVVAMATACAVGRPAAYVVLMMLLDTLMPTKPDSD